MVCKICGDKSVESGVETCYTVHTKCLDKPLQPYGVFADIERHIERSDPMPHVHVLPVADGKYYLRADVDRLLGRTP